MDIEALREWIGRRETAEDFVTPTPLALWRATLDLEAGPTAPGTPLPPLAHWLYFLPGHRASELGPDGHARRGGFLPPVPLPRRMWAGGRFEFRQPIRVGDRLRRDSCILEVEAKSGRSGPLGFVRVEHRISSQRGLALIEEHDIVYREAPRPGDAASPEAAAAASPGEWHEPRRADEVLLFRYSALTFNGHRIHYDRRYATEIEGYPGLVIHGPLVATLLAELALRRNGGVPLRSFSFRALRPLFDVFPFAIDGRPDGSSGAELRALTHDGQPAMTARAGW